MTVVVDTNVVVSAAFWPRSEDRRCFVLLARRKCCLAVTEIILEKPLGIEIVTPREFNRWLWEVGSVNP